LSGQRQTDGRLGAQEMAAWRGFLRAHSSLVRQLDGELSATQELPLRSYEVLLLLDEAPGRRLRMSDLSRSVLLSPSGVTRLVDRLEHESLVHRERCAEDGRGCFAVLTESGRRRLHAARATHLAGVRRLFLDRSDAPGGRVRTDVVDGFVLDRGFQVLLTAYPEARRLLDYERLRLRPFTSGALIRRGGRFARVADPFRHPFQALESLRGAPGTLLDKLRVARLRTRLARVSPHEVLTAPQATTAEALRREGFSPEFVDAFFRPFLGGVFLDPSLETSSRLFAFVFKLFAEGEAALPAAGMQEIPRQLAEALPETVFRFGATVESAGPGKVVLAGGERLTAAAVVVAADGPEAARLTGAVEAPAARAVTNVHYTAERTPVGEPILVLNGDGRGPVNDLCVPSDVAPSYAPPGASLVSATVLGVPPLSDAALDRAVRDQLRDWFGTQVDAWRLLRVHRIPFALPAQPPAALVTAERPVRLQGDLFVCGDHRDTASLQGAMISGRRAAAAVRGLDIGPACAP
jgi:DNA-binding MarR family transcriptional regulator